MANKNDILNKIHRDLGQLGLSSTRTTYAVKIGNLIIRYLDDTMSGPMGGVSDASAPYLGLGAGNPGAIEVSGLLDADNAITDLLATEDDLKAFRICSMYGNSIAVLAGDTASADSENGAGTQLAYLPSDATLKVLGQ
jgi:hypothetical protein